MKRLLLIEDDEALRSVLAQVLGQEGYTVTQAANGRAALKHLAETPVDLVITDLIMPEMDGVEIIRILRSRYPSVKIIAISGGGLNSAESYLQIAARMGVQKTLAKPFTPEELVAAIHEASTHTPNRFLRP